MLSATRGRIWRANKAIKLADFADDMGRPLTLALLVDREADLILKLSKADIRAMAQSIGEARLNRSLKKKATRIE